MAALWPWCWISLQQKWVQGLLSGGGKGGQCIGLTTLPPSCAHCLEIWEPPTPGNLRGVQACNGIDFTFYGAVGVDLHSQNICNKYFTRFSCQEITWYTAVWRWHLSRLRQLIGRFLPRKLRFELKSLYVRSDVDKQVFLRVHQFSPVSIIPPLLHTHSSIYHSRCIMFFSHYFSFPLSVSFHHCSILIHPSTTHAV